MRIVELKIENFGVLAQRGFDFDSGFQLIYGHNEAGKSTLLELIRQWLFGFDRQNVYAFDNHFGKMAAQGVIELQNGNLIEVRRMKKERDPVQGEFLDDNHPINEANLTQLLGNAHRHLYQNIFGFSLAELSAGEKSIENGRIHDALCGAGFGNLSQFQQLKDQLAADHDDLFTERGRKKEINRLLSDIRKQASNVDAATIKPRQYARLIQERDAAKREMLEQGQWRDQLSARCSHLQGLLKAWKPWTERRVLQQQIDDLGWVVHLPSDIDQQFRQVRERKLAAETESSEIGQELRENTTLLAELQLAPDLTKHAAGLGKLVQEIGHIESIRNELPKTEQRVVELEAAVENIMRELNPCWNASHLETFQTSLAQRMTVDTMSEERAELTRRRTQWDRDHVAMQGAIESDKKKIEQLHADDRMDRWHSICQRIAEHRHQQKTAAELEERLESCQQRMEFLQARLEDPLGKLLPSLPRLPIPLEQTVIEFRERSTEMQRQTQRHLETAERLADELASKRSELNRLDAEHQVPDRQQLYGQRARRDAGWQLIRRKYVNQKDVDQEILWWLDEPHQSLPDTFEQLIRFADEMADRRQVQAETVARQEHLDREIENLERQQQQAKKTLAEAHQAEKELSNQWHNLWADCHIQPLSPQAMLDWLQLYTEFVDKHSEHSLLVQKRRVACDKIGDFEDELDEVFPAKDTAIEQRLRELQQRYQASIENASQHDVLQSRLDEQREFFFQQKLELTALKQVESQWQQRWSDFLKQCGFPLEWDDKIAKHMVEGLQQAKHQQLASRNTSQHSTHLAEQISVYERRVLNLCQKIATDPSDIPAEQAVLELNRRMDAANQAQQQHDTLVKAEGKLIARQQRIDKQLSDVQAQLAEFMSMAGVDNEVDFFAVAANAEKRRKWSEQTDNLTKQLGIVRALADETIFEKQLSTGNEDEWLRELEDVQRQLVDAQQHYEAKVSQHALAGNSLAQLDGTSEAAQLQMDLESSRGKLAEAVDRWVPLKLASYLLTTAIDEFARQHQPAMLKYVETLLGKLTAGRYVSVQRILDQHGTLMISSDDQQWLKSAQLSRGTREHLYLAIGLAYIQYYSDKSEPLPIVMDDILVNFDDARCEATLRVLAEFSKSTQIIFLTCHASMVEKIRRILPATKPIDLATSGDLTRRDAAAAPA